MHYSYTEVLLFFAAIPCVLLLRRQLSAGLAFAALLSITAIVIVYWSCAAYQVIPHIAAPHASLL